MTVWKAILLTLFYIVLGILIQVGLLSLVHLLDLENEKYWILAELCIIISILVSFYIFYRIFIKKQPILKQDLNGIRFARIYLLLFIAIGLFLFDKILFDGYYFIFTDDFKIEKFNIKKYQFDYIQLIYLISPLILAPVLEEIIFRKFIFLNLLEKNSLITSIIISSLCFSMIHLPNFRNLLPTFIFGIIASYLFYKSRNILYPIILHFFGNFLWAIFKYYNHSIQENFQEIKFNFLYWLFTIAGLVMVLIALNLFIKNLNPKQN